MLQIMFTCFVSSKHHFNKEYFDTHIGTSISFTKNFTRSKYLSYTVQAYFSGLNKGLFLGPCFGSTSGATSPAARLTTRGAASSAATFPATAAAGVGDPWLEGVLHGPVSAAAAAANSTATILVIIKSATIGAWKCNRPSCYHHDRLTNRPTNLSQRKVTLSTSQNDLNT